MKALAPQGQRIGFVLGSGSARGWAHIGILRALAEAGIEPDVICGCSIGALVGAAYANGDLDKLETWVRGLGRRDVVGLMDLSFNGGGLLKGDRLMAFFARHFVDREFEQLPMPFACVATDLASGREVWLREGSVAAAVRAAIAMPGLFTPVVRDGRLLVDGALVNPVPVSLCRAMGADIVIAIDLNSDIVGSALRKVTAPEANGGSWGSRLLGSLGLARGNGLPQLSTVLSASLQIMQTRIGRARLAGEPADVLLSPRLAHLAPMDYHRAEEAIAEGRAVVGRMMPAITHALAI